MSDVFVQPSGQDDNLGDSVLRAALLRALRTPRSHLHLYLPNQTSDYLAGLSLSERDVVYSSRSRWLESARSSSRPIYAYNAGEISGASDGRHPGRAREAEVRSVVGRGGVSIASGMGFKHPDAREGVRIGRSLRGAAVVSWRDQVSHSVSGIGEVVPDWAFARGTDPDGWIPRAQRTCLAVTLRFDRPWPDDDWIRAVRNLASRLSSSVVTLAQVARDAPRAVHLAEALGGQYAMAPSTRHDLLDAHVRSVYARSIAVLSDRAHALIIGATEGAQPLGSAGAPQKITRMMDAASLGSLVGSHAQFSQRVSLLEDSDVGLAHGVTEARARLRALTRRVQEVIDG